jgi:hypothetical protein
LERVQNEDFMSSGRKREYMASMNMLKASRGYVEALSTANHMRE